MAKITFETKNKTQAVSDFPKLKLDKNQRVRVAILENPEFAYVHDLRAPKIVDGKPVYKSVDRKDGTTFQALVTDWLSRSRCKGDEDTLGEVGIDPKNCAVCALAKENSAMAEAPKRRFAVHVVKYNTNPANFNLTDAPYGVNILVWQFTDVIFNKLVDIASIVGSLQEHDLLLGPCTDPQFQKFDINYDVKALWNSSPEYRETTLATLKANRAGDLLSLVGRNTEQRWIDQDIEKIREAHRTVNGKGAEPTLAAKELPGLTDSLNNLLDEKPAETPAVTTKPADKTEPKAATWEDLLDV